MCSHPCVHRSWKRDKVQLTRFRDDATDLRTAHEGDLRVRPNLAKLLALVATLAAAIRTLILTAADLGQICTSEVVSVPISMVPLAQLVVIGAGELIEARSRKLATALYLAAAALLVVQQLLIASC